MLSMVVFFDINQLFMKKSMFLTMAVIASSQMNVMAGAITPSWLRYSSISPDGTKIAFAYRGDIYTVPVGGGEARQITANAAYDYSPVWSPDGKYIAFASDREGSKDIFVTSTNGGSPRRLTTNSGSEVPVAFLDNENILFTSAGTPSPENMQFPSGIFPHIYKVNLNGGRPEVYSEWSMGNPSVGKKGVLYEDIKGYEDYWRKHQTSSIAKDIWMFDGKEYKRLTDFKGEDRNPVWSSDESSFYYLSERNGSFNVFCRNLADGKDTQITFHKTHPVRFLSISDKGTLCYCYDGDIYTVTPGGKPSKLKLTVTTDDMARKVVRNISSYGASQVSVSPEGKEVAFIMNGDVYVTSSDYTTTKQITDTPERERTVDFAPDGRSLVYASERDGKWQIYQATIADKEDKNFTYCKEVKEERLTDGKYTSFQPEYNPKGKEVAFLKNRTELCVIDLKSHKVRTVMNGKYQYSYSDGDQTFSWSPDGKWLLSEYIGTGGWNNKDIALVKADGSGEIHNVTNSGYSEGNPRWVLDGKAMIFQSDRAGYRSHGSWGSESDVYITFFDRDAYDRFRMNKEELALLEEKEKAEKEEKAKSEAKNDDKKKKKDKKSESKDGKDKKDEDKSEDLKFDLSSLQEWTMRLTPYSATIGDAVLNKKGDKLYYVAPHEGKPALWEQNLKEHSNKLKMQGMSWAYLDLSKDTESAYFTAGGQIKKLKFNEGSVSGISFETFSTERPEELRAYLFDHIWNQTKEKLYDPGMNGTDWNLMYKEYAKFLPHLANNYDFAEMASEMLGELNVSHTGCRFGGGSASLPVASLAVFYDRDYKGDGLKIKEMIKGSPLESNKDKITSGCIITAIDGIEIKAGMDYNCLLEGKAGKYTRLTVKDGKKEFIATVKPVSSGTESELLYKRWVKRNKEMVDKLSAGRLAYVHIKAMDAGSFHELYRVLLNDENRKKEAVIVDTRHNGGGWLHDDVCLLLSGKKVMEFRPRGQFIGNDPFDRWTKPSCMLICEDNYSNAHGTPWYYKELGLGKLVGTPVPGTMTAVWWEGLEGGLVFGIPQVGAYDNKNRVLENMQLEADVPVYNKPEDILKGRDTQLEAAVNELLGK